MKKIASILLSLILILTAMPISYFTSAEEFVSGDYTYEILTDGTASITKYNGTDVNVSIPEKIDGYDVTVIGQEAFYGNEDIVSVSLPDSVTTIGYAAFSYCTRLNSITFNNVKELGERAFYNSVNLENCPLPNTLEKIGAFAFYESDIVDLEFPDSLKDVGNFAFGHCNKIKTIKFGTGLTVIPDNAFCYATSLTTLELPDCMKKIGGYAFNGCTNLKSVYIPSGVNNIQNYAFVDCTSLKEVELPATVATLNEKAFGYCMDSTKIPDFTIKGYSGIGVAERYAYLNEINFVDLSENPQPSVNGLRYKILEDDTVEITYYAGFGGDIVVPDKIEGRSVTSIGKHAFYKYSNITSISLPDSIKYIGDAAFYECYNIESVNIPNSVLRIDMLTFAGCVNITEITLPDGITTIGPEAFDGCNSLTEVTVPNSVTDIGGSAFGSCKNLTSVTVPSSIVSVRGVYGGKFSEVFYYCEKLTSITIIDGTTTIAYQVFNNYKFAEITIPKSVTQISNHAFVGCSKLTDVYYYGTEEDWNNIAIDESGNDPLLNATIHYLGEETPAEYFTYTIENDEVTITGLADGYAPEDLVLPATIEGYPVTTIHHVANYGALKSVTIPTSITKIKGVTFENCYKLTDIYYGGTVKEFLSIATDSRNECIYNSTLHLGDGSTYEFDEIAKNFRLNFADGKVTILGLVDGYNITELEIPEEILGDKVTTIGEEAFLGDGRNLETVVLPDSIEVIEENAFLWCEKLTSINMPKNLISIGKLAFQGCFNLEKIELPDGVKEIGEYAFDGCVKVESLKIPNSVTEMGHSAFGTCTNLKTVTLSNQLKSISGRAFYNCSNLEEITIPEGVTTIVNSAFEKCSSLKSITLSNKVTNIATSVFDKCESLTDVYYYGTEEEWEDIITANGNEPLLNATIHFLGEEETADVDLSVTTVSTSQSTVIDGEATNLYCMITNLGAEDTNRVITIDFYVDNLFFESVRYEDVIPAGGRKLIATANQKAMFFGAHSIKAVVNSHKHQPETDKSNNALKSRLLVKD